MSSIEITPELLAELRLKAVKANVVEDNRTSVIMEFCEPELDLILTLKPAMIFALVAEIERLREFVQAVDDLGHECCHDECVICKTTNEAKNERCPNGESPLLGVSG